MKAWITNSCIILAVVVSCWLYRSKFDKRPTDLEKISSGLAGIHTHLSPYIHIGVRSDYLDGTYYSLVANYALFPTQTDQVRNYDTILYILPNDVRTDDSLYIQSKKKKIIWQNKDSDIQYILTCN